MSRLSQDAALDMDRYRPSSSSTQTRPGFSDSMMAAASSMLSRDTWAVPTRTKVLPPRSSLRTFCISVSQSVLNQGFGASRSSSLVRRLYSSMPSRPMSLDMSR